MAGANNPRVIESRWGKQAPSPAKNVVSRVVKLTSAKRGPEFNYFIFMYAPAKNHSGIPTLSLNLHCAHNASTIIPLVLSGCLCYIVAAPLRGSSGGHDFYREALVWVPDERYWGSSAKSTWTGGSIYRLLPGGGHRQHRAPMHEQLMGPLLSNILS